MKSTHVNTRELDLITVTLINLRTPSPENSTRIPNAARSDDRSALQRSQCVTQYQLRTHIGDPCRTHVTRLKVRSPTRAAPGSHRTAAVSGKVIRISRTKI